MRGGEYVEYLFCDDEGKRVDPDMTRQMKYIGACLFFFLCAIVPAMAEPAQQADPKTSQDKTVANNETESFDFATGLFTRGMYDMAADEYIKFLAGYPSSQFREAVEYRIGECHFLDKKYPDAIKYFEEFKKKNPASANLSLATLRIAQSYFFTGDNKKAKEMIAAILADKKNQKEVMGGCVYYLGLIALKEDNIAECKKQMGNLVSAYQDSVYIPVAYMALGDINLKEKNYAKAVECYQKAATAPGVDKDIAGKADLGTADSYYLSGDNASAEKYYKKLMDETKEGALFDQGAIGYLLALYQAALHDRVIAETNGIVTQVKDPNIKAECYLMLGNSLFQQNKMADAEKIYQNVSEAYKGMGAADKAVLNMCWALLKNEKYAECLRNIDMYLVGAKTSLDEALYLKLKVLEKLSKTEEAIAVGEKLLNEYKTSKYAVDVQYEVGWMYDNSEKFEKAIACYKTFQEQYPDDPRVPEVVLKSGQNYLALKKYSEAEGEYKKFISKYPANSLKEKVLYQLGSVYTAANNADAVISTYESFVKEFPKSQAKDSAVFMIAQAYMQKGAWDKVISRAAELVSDKKSMFCPNAMDITSYAYFMKGDTAKAADSYRELMLSGFDYKLQEDIYRWAADYYFKEGASEKSLDVLKAFKAKYPNKIGEGVMEYMSAENVRRLGRIDEAITEFKKLIDNKVPSPYLERAYLGLGRCFHAKKDEATALGYFDEALKYNTDNMVGAYARFETGDIKSAMGQYADAAKSYAMVAILYDDKDLSPKALFRAGEAFARSGDQKKADEMFGELVSRYPEDPLAKEAGAILSKNAGQK